MSLRDKLSWWIIYGLSVKDFYDSWHFEFNAMKKAHELKTGKKMVSSNEQLEKSAMVDTVSALFKGIKSNGRK